MLAWARKELHFEGTPDELPGLLKTSGLYPLSSSDFWRLKAPTDHVDFETADSGARWHCAGCVEKWG